jgi:hypothetical protein
VLDAECAKIFRIKSPADTFGKPMVLHRHQRDAIEVALTGESYVLTTGTGSGKSLSYFIPIINDVLRRKQAGQPSTGITAIIVYPMNALCNSQREELERFLKLGYNDGKEPVRAVPQRGVESRFQVLSQIVLTLILGNRRMGLIAEVTLANGPESCWTYIKATCPSRLEQWYFVFRVRKTSNSKSGDV